MNNAYNADIDIFLHNIAWLRRQHRLSKKEMAKRLGIGLASLNKIEKGQMPPRLGASIFFTIYEQFGLLPSVQLTKLPKD